MRTFKQYIKETVDFRLGGKGNKGVVSKTFSEPSLVKKLGTDT